MVKFGVIEEGFDTKNLESIRESLEDRARKIFGEDIDLSQSSVLRKLIDVTVLELSRLWDTSQNVYSSSYLEEASGESLERLGYLMGVHRMPATRALGEVTFYGDEGVIIEEGFTVSTRDNIKYETTESGEISEEGEVTLEVRALSPGEDGNAISPDMVTVLIDSKMGVTGVTNEETITGGQDREEDGDLRHRIRTAIDVEGKAVKSAIEQSLLNIFGVTSVTLLEHYDRSVTAYIGGLGDKINIPDDKKLEVDEVLEENRAFGVSFEWLTPIHSYLTISGVDVGESELDDVIVKVKDAPEGSEDEIKSSLVEYINNLDVGEDVVFKKVIDVIYNTGNWVYDIENLHLAKDWDDEWEEWDSEETYYENDIVLYDGVFYKSDEDDNNEEPTTDWSKLEQDDWDNYFFKSNIPIEAEETCLLEEDYINLETTEV